MSAEAYFPDEDELNDDYDSDDCFNSDDNDPELKEIRDRKKCYKRGHCY